jgi:hypothetical protein
MTQLLAEGRLAADSPFTDGSGTLFRYEAKPKIWPGCTSGAAASWCTAPAGCGPAWMVGLTGIAMPALQRTLAA